MNAEEFKKLKDRIEEAYGEYEKSCRKERNEGQTSTNRTNLVNLVIGTMEINSKKIFVYNSIEKRHETINGKYEASDFYFWPSLKHYVMCHKKHEKWLKGLIGQCNIIHINVGSVHSEWLFVTFKHVLDPDPGNNKFYKKESGFSTWYSYFIYQNARKHKKEFDKDLNSINMNKKRSNTPKPKDPLGWEIEKMYEDVAVRYNQIGENPLSVKTKKLDGKVKAKKAAIYDQNTELIKKRTSNSTDSQDFYETRKNPTRGEAEDRSQASSACEEIFELLDVLTTHENILKEFHSTKKGRKEENRREQALKLFLSYYLIDVIRGSDNIQLELLDDVFDKVDKELLAACFGKEITSAKELISAEALLSVPLRRLVADQLKVSDTTYYQYRNEIFKHFKNESPFKNFLQKVGNANE